jgi:hypothetical protein
MIEIFWMNGRGKAYTAAHRRSTHSEPVVRDHVCGATTPRATRRRARTRRRASTQAASACETLDPAIGKMVSNAY